ncbi:MAG: type 2 lanthipeptide synthetase LanM [Rivularia sp. (in: cyanobacteria)]
MQLPTYRKLTQPSFRGARLRFALTKTLTEALKHLSQKQGVTLFMMLLAAFKTLLYRYTAREDLLIGTATAGRNQPELESLIGCFVNTVVLRTDLSGNPNFLTLLERVRDVTLEAYAHQDLPFEKLVEELQPQRDLNHSPLFQIGFAFYNAPKIETQLSNLTLNSLEVDSGTSKLDLTISFKESEAGLIGNIEYKSELYDAETIIRMQAHFQTLLEGIVANPQQRLHELPLLTTAEIEQYLQWNNTQTQYPSDFCIHQLFESQVERSPDAIALIFNDSALTYRELNIQASQLANYLQSLGIKPEMRVGVYIERSPLTIISILAIFKAGGVYVPLDPTYPQERLAFMIEDAQLSLLLTQESLGIEPEETTTVVYLDREWGNIAQHNDGTPRQIVTPDNIAYIIYTSGSTGKPKGVLLEHRGLCNLATAQMQVFDIRHHSRVLQFASLSFDASISEIFMTLVAGATLCLATTDDLLPGTNLLRLLRDRTITTVTLPPSVLAVLPESELPDLQTIIERGLLQRLVNLSAKTLQFEFSNFRPHNYNQLNLILEQLNLSAQIQSDNPSKEYYINFVNKLLKDGLLAFFQQYPVLGRLIATTIDFWVEATVEFLQRLQADKPKIERILKFTENYLGKVTFISGSLSDYHNRGRSVLILTFTSGQKLVYKPKNLGLDVVYNQLLDWCNQHSTLLSFKVIKLLDCHNYGWVLNYVEQQPCDDEEAAKRFYQRAGMLLAILYVLGANDCHYENLIACGEHPILIDTETLLHPQAQPIEASMQAIEEMTDIEQQFQDSVLRTGLLRRWDFSPDGRIAYDISALGSVNPQQAPWRSPRWKAVNTDEMHLAYEKVKLELQANVPMLRGVALSPNDYLEEIVAGFREMYQFLSTYRQALLKEDEFLNVVKAQQVRFIFRATKIYQVLLEKTLVPQSLRNGVERSIELDILSQTFLTSKYKPKPWSILRSEIQAMEQLDIPYFGTSCSSDGLTVGLKEPIKKYFKQPSYNQFLTRLQNLNEADLIMQVGIIRGSFYTRVAQTNVSEESSAPNSTSFLTADFSQIPPLNSSQLLQKVDAIAREIESRCLRTVNGNVNWIGFSYAQNTERFQFEPLGYSLYDGTCGVALFLAAVAHITGKNNWSNLALDALQSLRTILHTPNELLKQKFARRIGIGAGTGIASIIYSLVKISQFLSNTALLKDAQLAAKLITPELIAADQQLDLMGGAAGAILGLLTLYQKTGESEVLDKAILCGKHLLSHRVSESEQPRAWTTIAEKPLTGFSHGAAGIAYALLRLYAVTKDLNYLKAGEEGIAYEDSLFSSSALNWPDLRHQSAFMVTWCHGAPGIVLSRLGILSIYQTDEIYKDVEIGLQTTQKYGLQGVDHLCCGNFGRIEVLLVAGLYSYQLLEIAQKKAAWVVAKADKIGAYQLFGNLPNSLFNPGFFQGTAGIGYQLLRLAYPQVFPSVLLWD